jgi:undecaprenyl phosphate-alpha-L-ara4N flippase subunit ArnE
MTDTRSQGVEMPLDHGVNSPKPTFTPFGWFFNAYFQILVGALCDTAGELLLKKGATAYSSTSGIAGVIGVTPLASAWTWLGIIIYICSLLSWLYVLRTVPISIAFPLINAVHVFVPVGSWLFLHEQISFRRWFGIGLILCGILALIKPLTRAEEKL